MNIKLDSLKAKQKPRRRRPGFSWPTFVLTFENISVLSGKSILSHFEVTRTTDVEFSNFLHIVEPPYIPPNGSYSQLLLLLLHSHNHGIGRGEIPANPVTRIKPNQEAASLFGSHKLSC